MTVLARARAWSALPLYRNAVVLMVNTGLTAGLGFVFWALAARLYPPAELGLGSATISAALFVTTVAHLGLPYAFVRFAPAAGAARATFASTILFVVTVAAVLAGAVFVAGFDTWAPALNAVGDRPAVAVSIMSLAGATAASTMLVYVAIGARDTRPALIGGLAHGMVKCGLIVAFAVLFAHVGLAVVGAWLLGTLAAVGVQLWLLRRRLAPRVDLDLLRLGSFLRYCAANYGGELAWTAPGLLYPLLVVGLLGAEENAYFYIAWAIAGVLAGIPTAVASSLLAEGSHAHAETANHLRRALLLGIAIVTPAVAVVWFGAPLLLSLFGSTYVTESVGALRLLSLAALPLSVNMQYIAVARVDRAMPRVLGITAVTGGAALVLAAGLGVQRGIEGMALAYLLAQTAMAIVLLLQGLRGARPVKPTSPH